LTGLMAPGEGAGESEARGVSLIRVLCS
jgi:hypothetical protein